MNSIEESRSGSECLGDLCHPSTNIRFVIEAFFSLLHFATQISADIEPIPRCLLRLVAGGIEIMQLVNEAIEGV